MRAPPWKQTRTNAQLQWFYSCTSYLSQDPFLLFVGFMLVLGHLQKVLFAADEAHRASHPSDAGAHTSKPIQHPSSRGWLLLSLPQSAADDFIPLTQASCARSGSGIAASVSRALEVCEVGAHTGSPIDCALPPPLLSMSVCLPVFLSLTHLCSYDIAIGVSGCHSNREEKDRS